MPLFRSCNIINEFGNVKFSKSLSCKDGVFKKISTSKREFSYLFSHSTSHNKVVVSKRIYFSPTYLKLWVHISDNIAGVVGGPP